jgi:hypothetical protein
MRGKATFLVLALSGMGSGCALIQDGARNICTDIRDHVDDARERVRNRRWAEEWWGQVCAASMQPFSPEYAQGFKDGFVEYLFSGNTEPPPVAPLRFRGYRYQTPQGYQAIEDWFAGYRHGVSAAIDSGYRRWITAPVAVPLPPGPPPLVPPPPAPLPAVLPTTPAPEPLPAPRPVETKVKPQQQAAVPPQEVVSPPLEVTPPVVLPQVVIRYEEPPPAIVLPPRPADSESFKVADWPIQPVRFGAPLPIRGEQALRPTVFGVFLPPAAAPETDTGSEEQEPPTLGLPQPRMPVLDE